MRPRRPTPQAQNLGGFLLPKNLPAELASDKPRSLLA